MKDLTPKLQASLGRQLIDREIKAIEQHVNQYGTPKIEIGEPWFRNDRRRPVGLTWMVDGQARSLSLSPSAPVAKQRNPVRERLEQHAKEHGGVLVTEKQHIGLDGRRTLERSVRRFRSPGCQLDAASDLTRAAPTTRARERRPKSQATRSSARSGDSGDEGPSDEPPPAGRLCGCGCRTDITHKAPQARYLNDTHAAADRQRRKRDRDRERGQLPRVATTADFRRMLEITDEDGEQLRALAVCGCNGRHVEFEPGECFRCGHWLPRGAA